MLAARPWHGLVLVVFIVAACAGTARAVGDAWHRDQCARLVGCGNRGSTHSATAAASLVPSLEPSPTATSVSTAPPPSQPTVITPPLETRPPIATNGPTSIKPLPTIDDPNADDLQAFWSQVIDLSCIAFGQDEDWESLKQMTNDVDIVVLGRPTSVSTYYDSERQGDRYLVDFTVDEVIKGDLSTDMTGVLRLDDWYGAFSEKFDAPIPSTTTLLFARNKALREQLPGLTKVPGDEFRYYLPSNYQNVYPDLNGKVFITYPTSDRRLDRTRRIPSRARRRVVRRSGCKGSPGRGQSNES